MDTHQLIYATHARYDALPVQCRREVQRRYIDEYHEPIAWAELTREQLADLRDWIDEAWQDDDDRLYLRQ